MLTLSGFRSLSPSYALLGQRLIFCPSHLPFGDACIFPLSLSYDPLAYAKSRFPQLSIAEAVSGCIDSENGLLFSIEKITLVGQEVLTTKIEEKKTYPTPVFS